jgi:hypothetical protein
MSARSDARVATSTAKAETNIASNLQLPLAAPDASCRGHPGFYQQRRPAFPAIRPLLSLGARARSNQSVLSSDQTPPSVSVSDACRVWASPPTQRRSANSPERHSLDRRDQQNNAFFKRLELMNDLSVERGERALRKIFRSFRSPEPDGTR